MVVSPLVAVVLSSLLNPASPFAVSIFFVETFGVWAFAAYWMYTGTVASGLFGLIYREGVEKLRAVPAEVSAPAEVPPAPPAPALG